MTDTGRAGVAVIGMGVKTPAGSDLETFWANLLAGRSGVARVTAFDPSDLPVQFAGEVTDFDPEAYIGYKEARRADRVAQLGFAAAADALADAGDIGADPARCGVVGGHRRRRADHPGGAGAHHVQGRPQPGQPLPGPDDDAERHRRHDRHEARLDGAELLRGHRLRRRHPRRGGGRPPDP